MPKSVEEAKEIDKEYGNHLWRNAICLEMNNVRVGFEVYEGDVSDLVGYEENRGHLIFHIKLRKIFVVKLYTLVKNLGQRPLQVSHMVLLCVETQYNFC